MKSFASEAGRATRFVFGALYYLLPNFSHFAYITDASHGRTPDPAAFGVAVLYALVYVAALVSASALVFNRRNFK